MPAETDSGRPLALTGRLLLAACGIWLLAAVVDLPLHSRFSIDEFEYAHGAWLTARGEVIYRDFFEAHFPLIHQVMALPWLFLEDEPVNILVLRIAMVPIFGLLVLAAASLNARRDRLAGWVTAVVILATGSLVGMGLEIRPDPLAFALFLAAVAVLHRDRPSPRLRGFAAGALSALALWGSQKVVYYGIVLAAALVADVFVHRRGRQLLADWRAFLAGAAAVAAAVAAYLTATGSWAAWVRWSLLWVVEHQRSYPGFPWTKNFVPFFGHHTWLFALAAVGVAVTVRRLARGGRRADPDLLVLGLLLSSLASAAWQTAGFMYSFIPFATLLTIFAARGVVELFGWLHRLRATRPGAAVFGIALAALLLVGEAVHVRTLYRIGEGSGNADQLATLRRLGEISEPGDPVFDIAGRRVARPGVHFFYFTDAVIRAQEAEVLATQIPAAILERGCTVYLHDPRWPSLPPRLRAFLLANFQPMDEAIWLWGRRYPAVAANGPRAHDFLAVRDGSYFVHPPAAAAGLSIDGRNPGADVFELARGVHRVEHAAGDGFAILWLPRDGARWQPRPHPVLESRPAEPRAALGATSPAGGRPGSDPSVPTAGAARVTRGRAAHLGAEFGLG